jgi:hypothetical protein
MNHHELSFQNDFCRELTKHGWSWMHLGGSGVPDLLCFKYPNYGMVIELKIIENGKENRAIRSLFKPTQRPFYIHHLDNGGTPVKILFQYIHDGEDFYYGTVLKDSKGVREFFEMKT